MRHEKGDLAGRAAPGTPVGTQGSAPEPSRVPPLFYRVPPPTLLPMNEPAHSRPDGPVLSPPWGPVDLPEGRSIARRIGPRDLWLRLDQGEVRLADAPAPSGSDEADALPPDGVEWSRWALPPSPDSAPPRVTLRPAFPDRALIVQPDTPFSLLPRAEARVFVRVPLDIRVEVETTTGESVALRTIPAVALSDTWWGDFLEGELCYWLTTTARRQVTRALLEPHLVICPLRMVNASDDDLKVEKLAFRVEHLSLYAEGAGFWADESRVRYHGDQEGSRIDMTGTPPEEARDARLVMAPPVPARGIRALTFNRLRHLSGLGGAG
jgi:hypothetical protein